MKVRLKDLSAISPIVAPMRVSAEQMMRSNEALVYAILFTNQGVQFLLAEPEDFIPAMFPAEMFWVTDGSVDARWKYGGAVAGTSILGLLGYPYLASSEEAVKRTFELDPGALLEIARFAKDLLSTRH